MNEPPNRPLQYIAEPDVIGAFVAVHDALRDLPDGDRRRVLRAIRIMFGHEDTTKGGRDG